MGKKELDTLFIPGKGRVVRTPNRLRKGYLKKSMFLSMKWYFALGGREQGERECQRRLRQVAAGQIPPEQLHHSEEVGSEKLL